MKLLQRHKKPALQPMATAHDARADVVDSEGGSFHHADQQPLVDIAPYASDNRYRLVRMGGGQLEPLAREEFVPRVHQLYPELDLDDAELVHWADRPWEWPPWHPGAA
ncbi:hypothetical protein [Streptacidiphilus anmyonensis]|uniref:hypothetical protein n=1 Tax=Streptacidiphilus anmyonensis TaxID=405782 RepID=UPI001F25D893|nr:hypothetical protein [Streptacidiphilus anmyonensis]